MSSFELKLNTTLPLINWTDSSTEENPVVKNQISDIAADVLRSIEITRDILEKRPLSLRDASPIVGHTLLHIPDSPDLFENLPPEKMRMISHVYQQVFPQCTTEDPEGLKYATLVFAITAINRFNRPITPEFTAYVLEAQNNFKLLTDEKTIHLSRMKLDVLLNRSLITLIEVEAFAIQCLLQLTINAQQMNQDDVNRYEQQIEEGLKEIKMYQAEEMARSTPIL